MGGRFLALILIGRSLEALQHQREQASLVGGVEKKPLVSGVVEFNLA
jgi:hypothetical protein